MPEENTILIWHELDPASFVPLGGGEFVGLCGGGNRASGDVPRTVELYEVYLAGDGRTLTRPCRKVLGVAAGGEDTEELGAPTTMVIDGMYHLVYVGTAGEGAVNTVMGASGRFDPSVLASDSLSRMDQRRHIVDCC